MASMQTNTGNQPDQYLYNFYQLDLWQERIASLTHAIDSSQDMFFDALATIDGLTVQKVQELLREGEIETDFDELLAKLIKLNILPQQASSREVAFFRETSRGIRGLLEGEVDEGYIHELRGRLERADNWLSERREQIEMAEPILELIRALLEARPDEGLLYELADLLEELAYVVAQQNEGEQQFDYDFEVKQLLNLYAHGRSLSKFVSGTLKDIVDVYLKPTDDPNTMPNMSLVRECFQRVALDAELIQKAINHRRWHLHDDDNDHHRSPQARALLVADKLAFKSLAPFRHLLPVDHHITPITFFSLDTHIHRVPYRDYVILLGISHVHLSLGVNRKVGGKMPAFEFMVIPHEIGHYIYHHAQLPDNKTFVSLSEQFKDKPYYKWCEEIFADTYSCLISGPITALGLQALLAPLDNTALCTKDGEHPTAIIRPFVLSEILRELNRQDNHKYPFMMLAESLDENWKRILEQHGYHFSTDIAKDENCTIRNLRALFYLHLGETRAKVRPIIEVFVTELLANVQTKPWGEISPDDLSPDIPWVESQDHRTLDEFDTALTSLTDHDFAHKKVPHYTIRHTITQPVDTHTLSYAEAEQRLKELLDKWGDSGPFTIGDHNFQATNNQDVKSWYKKRLSGEKVSLAGISEPTLSTFFNDLNTWKKNPSERSRLEKAYGASAADFKAVVN